jgi:hypothetical protein
MFTCHREPTLAETLSDPLIQAVMMADGVDPGEVEVLLRRVARRTDHRRTGVRTSPRPSAPIA